ncbi:hypothetical protein F3I58_15840, partial [Pantoea sp. VH_4]|uniref:hypothetical protein n=1 Tax=Pantoea sp. VH_4 TaxID=2608047 RepID=UPI001232923B
MLLLIHREAPGTAAVHKTKNLFIPGWLTSRWAFFVSEFAGLAQMAERKDSYQATGSVLCISLSTRLGSTNAISRNNLMKAT